MDRIYNKEKLRFENEFVRHKILDFLGDLFLVGQLPNTLGNQGRLNRRSTWRINRQSHSFQILCFKSIVNDLGKPQKIELLTSELASSGRNHTVQRNNRDNGIFFTKPLQRCFID